jgi:hypothetical protein
LEAKITPSAPILFLSSGFLIKISIFSAICSGSKLVRKALEMIRKLADEEEESEEEDDDESEDEDSVDEEI